MTEKQFKDSSKKLESSIEDKRKKLRKLAFEYLKSNNLIVDIGCNLEYNGGTYVVVNTSFSINMFTGLPCVLYSLIKIKKSGDYVGKGRIVNVWDYQIKSRK